MGIREISRVTWQLCEITKWSEMPEMSDARVFFCFVLYEWTMRRPAWTTIFVWLWWDCNALNYLYYRVFTFGIGRGVSSALVTGIARASRGRHEMITDIDNLTNKVVWVLITVTSSWTHHDCLLNGLFRRRSKKTSKLRVTGLCEGNSPVTGEFPAQRASNTENDSIWWRHYVRHRHFSKFVPSRFLDRQHQSTIRWKLL